MSLWFFAMDGLRVLRVSNGIAHEPMSMSRIATSVFTSKPGEKSGLERRETPVGPVILADASVELLQRFEVALLPVGEELIEIPNLVL